MTLRSRNCHLPFILNSSIGSSDITYIITQKLVHNKGANPPPMQPNPAAFHAHAFSFFLTTDKSQLGFARALFLITDHPSLSFPELFLTSSHTLAFFLFSPTNHVGSFHLTHMCTRAFLPSSVLSLHSFGFDSSSSGTSLHAWRYKNLFLYFIPAYFCIRFK